LRRAHRNTHPLAFANSTSAPIAAVVLAGVVVGYGSRLGNGCTSGHGLCGTGRLSPRSMVAGALFTVGGASSLLLTNALMGGFR